MRRVMTRVENKEAKVNMNISWSLSWEKYKRRPVVVVGRGRLLLSTISRVKQQRGRVGDRLVRCLLQQQHHRVTIGMQHSTALTSLYPAKGQDDAPRPQPSRVDVYIHTFITITNWSLFFFFFSFFFPFLYHFTSFSIKMSTYPHASRFVHLRVNSILSHSYSCHWSQQGWEYPTTW